MKKTESKKEYKPSDFEIKIREEIIEEFKKVCPLIKVKEKDTLDAESKGLRHEDLIHSLFVNCISQLYEETCGWLK